jgi:cyclic beta-1,2-glucan synthetase
VVAADVYTAAGHVGRGGWSWYTGSASWMYRVGVEAILGFTKRADRLSLDPRVPAGWKEFAIDYRHGQSRYRIVVHEPSAARAGNQRVTLDGRELDGETVLLSDDGREHEVVIRPRDGTGPA